MVGTGPLSALLLMSVVGSARANAGAEALYRRTLAAQQTVPIQARATLTREGHGAERFDLLEGLQGQFRMTYVAPERVRGRVVVGDGRNVTQYEPHRRAVIRRQQSAPESPLSAAAPGPARAARIVGTDTIEGRPVTVLEITLRPGRTRRWVDTKTGRTLRMETFSQSGHRLQRLALERIVFPRTLSAARFRADFPITVRTTELGALARGVGLPATLPGRVLSAVSRLHASGRQFVYGQGAQSVSVFVTPNDRRLIPGKDRLWKSVRLSPGVDGYLRNDPDRVAVAWERLGHRYVAVGHLSPENLLSLVRALVR
jgi:outer membrane lipoprotein-sorting protein